MASITKYSMTSLYETISANPSASLGQFMIEDYANDITNQFSTGNFTVPALKAKGLTGITVLDNKPVTLPIASPVDLNNFVKITNSAGTASPGVTLKLSASVAQTFIDYSLSTLKTVGVTVFDITDFANQPAGVNLFLTPARFSAFNAANMKFAANDVVRLDAQTLDKAGLLALNLADMTSVGVKSIAISYHYVGFNLDIWTLTWAQLKPFMDAGIKLAHANSATDILYLSDTAANILNHSAAEFAALSAAGIYHIAITDATWSLSATQFKNINDAHLSFLAGQSFQLIDTATNIQQLSGQALADLTANGATGITVTGGGALTLSADQAANISLPITTSGAIIISDSATNIQAKLDSTLSILTKSGATGITVSDNAALTLSVAQATALGVKITSTGAVTVSDTGANIAGISDIQLGKLAGYGVTLLDASNNAVTLTQAQHDALKATTLRFAADDVVTVNGAVVNDLNNYKTLTLTVAELSTTTFGASDNITLSDTFDHIKGLADAALANIDKITLTDATVSLTLDQYTLLKAHGLAISNGQTVTLQVSAADLKDATLLAAIKATALPVDVTEASWSLTAAQFTAVKNAGISFIAGESFTIVDTVAGLQGVDFAAIKAAGGTGVTVSDSLTLWLDAAQGTALGFKITSRGYVMVSDTGANLGRIDAVQMGKLGSYGVSGLDSSTNAVTLSLAQHNALAASHISFRAGDWLTLSDTATKLKALDDAALTDLQNYSVKWIDATDASWTLSASQLGAFTAKGISLVAGDDITLSDTAAAITGLNANLLTYIDHITLTDTTVALTLAQFNTLNAHGLTIAANQTFRISDTAANIHNFMTADLAAIKAAGATGITVSDNAPLTLDAAQVNALTLPITSTGAVTIADTSANLLTLIHAKVPSSLAALGIKSLDSSDNAVTVSMAEYGALSDANLRFAANDVITLSQDANFLKQLATSSFAAQLTALQTFGVTKIGVTKIDATDPSWNLTWTELSAFKAKGISLVSSDDITLTGTFANISVRTAADLANIDHITITGSTAYGLTLAQYTVLKANGWAASAGQTVSLKVSAADLKDATQLAAIKTAALPVDVTDTVWSLTLAQFNAVKTANVGFVSGESFTLSDTAANLVKADGFLNLSATQLTALTTAHASGITVTGATTIYLTPDQTAALTIRISVAQAGSNNNVGSEAQPDAATLALIVKGTGAEIATKISANLFGQLAGLGVTDLNASDNQVSLSAAQYKALVDTSLRFDATDAITLSSADLGNLMDAQVSALKSNGVVAVSSTTTLSLTVAQYNALLAQNLPFTATTDLIIRDTSAAIAALSLDAIADLAAHGVDKLDSTSDSLSLTRAQQDKLAAVGIGKVAGDTITTAVEVFTYNDYTVAQYLLAHPLTNVGTQAARLVDTAANLAKITPEIAGYFAADKVTQISATDKNLAITTTQFDAIKTTGVTYDANNVVSIIADKATLTGFNATRLAEFKANGVDVLGSATPATAWTLTVAQYKAVTDAGLGFAQGDTITLLDTAANLQNNLVTSPTGATQVDIRSLAANGVDTIETSGNNAPLSFTVDQAKNLGAVKLATTFTATISDIANLISGMTGDQLAAASAAGFDAISANNGSTITLSVDKATKLGALKAVTAVTLTDSGTNIAKLTDVQIKTLADTNKILSYDVTDDNKVSLSAIQLAAIVAKKIAFTDDDIVTLSDLAANIQGLDAAIIAGLKAAGASGITVKDNRSLDLHADQADALNIRIKSTGAITLVDTGDEIVAKIDADQMGLLKGLGFTKINVDRDAIALHVDQYQSLQASGLTFTTGDVVSLEDSGDQLSTLDANALKTLAFGIKSIHSTDDLLLSWDQLAELVADHITYSADDDIVLSDAASVLTALTLDDLGYLKGKGVVRIDAIDDDYSLTVEQYQALQDANIALTPGDNVTLSDNGINLASLSVVEMNALYANGVDFINLQQDGDYVYSLNLTAEKWQALFKTDGEGRGVEFTDATKGLLADSIAHFAPIATLLDTADAIEALDAADLAAIANQNVVIDSSTDALTLSWEQFQALAELGKTGVLADGDTVTLSLADGDLPDVPPRIGQLADVDVADLQPAELWFTNIGLIGVDIISARDGALTLTKPQYDALFQQNTLEGWQTHAILKASDTFTLSISREIFQYLDSADIKGFSDNGIDKIHIEGSDGSYVNYPNDYKPYHGPTSFAEGAQLPVFLNAARAEALGSLVIENASMVVLIDGGHSIFELSAETFADLVKSGFTEITASDTYLNLSMDKYLAIAGTACKLNQADYITLIDKADVIAQRNPSQFAAMAGNGIDTIYTTDKMLTLKVEQAVELGKIVVEHELHEPNPGEGPADVTYPYFQILDSAANISKLSATDLQRLNTSRLDQINSTEGKISLNGAQLMALDAIVIAPGNVVTLFDSGAHIADIDFSKLADIGAEGLTNLIDANDNVLAITVDDFHNIVDATSWQLNPNDVITLGDSAKNLGDLSLDEISGPVVDVATGARDATQGLAGRGIDILKVTDGAELQLTLDKYQALIATRCSLTADDDVALKDITQSDLDTLTPANFRALAGNGIDTVRIADDSAVSLSVDKYLDLGVVKIATDGTYTLTGAAGAIAALTKDQFAALEANGVDVIDVSDDQPLRLTVEQYRKLGHVALTDDDRVILSDTVENLNTLSAVDIAGLTGAFVDAIEPTDGPFSLTLDKAKVLNAVKFEGANTVTVTGPGDDISALGESGIAALSAAGVDVIDADDTGPVTLDVGMLRALGAMTFATGDDVTLSDTCLDLISLTPHEIAKLGGQGIDVLDANNVPPITLRLSADQATSLGSVKLGHTNFVNIWDVPSAIQSLTSAQITSLAKAGLDGIDVSATAFQTWFRPIVASTGGIGSYSYGVAQLSLTAAQANALTLTTASDTDPVTYSVAQQIVVNSGADVTLSDTGANIAALSAQEIGYLAAVGVDQISATTPVTITVEQFLKLGNAKFTGDSQVTLADTAAHLKALTAGDIATLQSQGVDFVNPTDATLDLDADQAAALPSGVTFTGAKLVQIVDSGTNISTKLSGDQIALLSTAGVDWIDANDDAIKLSVAQANKLGSIKIAASDVATLSDTAATINLMKVEEISVLGAKGVDIIDARDSSATTLNLSVPQAKALGSVTLDATNLVQIQDLASAVQGLSGPYLTSLAKAGLDGIDVGANALSLTAAQANALTLTTAVAGTPVTYTVSQKIVVNSGADVTLSDTGANIAALSDREIGYLGAVGVDQISATTPVTITVDQFRSLGTAEFTTGSQVTLADTAAHLKALTAEEIATLQSQGVDFVNPTDATLDLDADQAAALPSGVTFTGAKLVQIVDSGTNISTKLSGDQIALLSTAGVDWIDANDDAIKLSVAQANKLGSIKIAASDVATLSDTAATINLMKVEEISVLGAKGVDIIDARDSSATTLNLSVPQAKALGSVTLDATNLVQIQDLASAVQGLSGPYLTSLAKAGLDGIDVGANALSLTAAQANALTLTTAVAGTPVTYTVSQKIVVNSGADVTLSDTGANIAALSAREIGYLAAVGVDKIDSTDADNKLSLSVAQYQALGMVALNSGDNVTLLDTAANLSALQPGDLTALAGKNIDVIDVSDNAMALTVAQYKALFLPATGVKLTGADVITLKDQGSEIAKLSADEMAGLALNGVDFIDAYDSTAAAGSQNNLTLNVQQYLRLIATSTALTGADSVTIRDHAAAIKGLTYAQISQLAANNVDFVDADDVPLELTVGDAKAFGSVKFGATKDVIVRDAADVISATSATDIQKLTANGVDRFVPITNYLRLTVDQAKNLGSTVVDPAAEAIVLDSAANIQKLTVQQIQALVASGIDRIDVEDNLSTPAVERDLSLSVDQYRALVAGGIKLTDDDNVTLTGTTGEIEGLTDAELSDLAGNRIDAIDVSGSGALSLTVDRLSRLGTVALTPGDVVTLADSGDHIATLGKDGIAKRAGQFVDFIDVTGDGKLTLDIASYNALGTVKLTDGDTVTLSDSALNWKAQSVPFFTGLNGKFIDAITVTDGDHRLALTVDQYRELIKYTKLTDGDDVTLSDTAGNLQGLTVPEIQALKANFVDHLDATDAMLDLPLVKATAIPAGVTFGTTKDVRVVDTATAISGLTATKIAALRDAGVDKIDAQASGVSVQANQAITIDLAMAKELGSMVFDPSDTVTLKDTAANLAASNLTPDLITKLGATNGVDVILSSETDHTLALTVDQYRKLIATSMKLTATDVVTLSDTAANLKGLTTGEIGALATNGVDILNVSSATDTTLDLSVAQVNVLPAGVTFGATKDVRIVDSGTAISGLSADRITLLNAAGLDKIDATDADPIIKLTAAQVAALGDSTVAGSHYITIAGGDDVTLYDDAAAIKTMALSTFQGLSAHGIDKIDAKVGTLDLTVAQVTANGRAVTLGDTNKVRIADAGATISNLSEQQIKDLDAAGLDYINADNNTVTLDAAKAKALGSIIFDASDNQVTLKDTAANLAAGNLSAADITRIAANGVDWILSSEANHTLALTVDQYRALVATLTTTNPLRLTPNDKVTLSDTATELAKLLPAEIADLATNGVDYVDSSFGVLNWTVDQATSLPAAVKFGATNLVQIADTVAHIDTLSVEQIKALDAAGLDYIDAVDATYRPATFAVSLSVDKALALGAIKMTLDDTVTLADSAGKIGGMSTQQLGKLKDANIDIIDVGGDGKMSLTVARFNALDSVQLTGEDTITLSDTAIALKSLWDNANTISTLATRNVDFIDVTVGQLNLTVAEAKLLPIYGADPLTNIKFATSNNANSVRIVDAANTISTDLSASDFAALFAASVNVIDASGNGAVTLDFAKAKALGSIPFDATDTVTMTLDAADLDAAILTPDLITRMGAVNGIDKILSSAADHTLSLTVDQYKALIATSMKLTLSDKVTLADTVGKLNTLSASDLGLLDDNGIDKIQPTDGPLSLTVAKATSIADGVLFVGVVQIADTGTLISNMSADQIAILARSGLTSIDATLADPNVTLSVRMATSLGNITFADNDRVTLSDYGPIVGAMSATEIAKLQTNGVDFIDVHGDDRLKSSTPSARSSSPSSTR